MTCIVATGATGFLGRHVVAALTARGHTVHALTRDPTSAEKCLPRDVILHEVNLFEQATVSRAIEAIRPSDLVHLAWEATPGSYWNAPINESWVEASLALFKTFNRTGGKRIVVAGTSAEYSWKVSEPLDERASVIAPASLYGSSKNRLRNELARFASETDMSWAWGRFFNMFGPYERPQRLIPRTIRSLLSGRSIQIDGGLMVRDFLYVVDAAEAFAALCESSFTGSVNVASGEGVAIRDLLTTIATEMGCLELVANTEADALSEPPYVVASARCLREEVGWMGGQGLRSGIRQTIQWWVSNAMQP